MNDWNKLTKERLELLKSMGVKRYAFNAKGADCLEEVEFFPNAPESMPLDVKSLAKTLTDSMPPDSSMLFASSEDLNEQTLDQSNGNMTP